MADAAPSSAPSSPKALDLNKLAHACAMADSRLRVVRVFLERLADAMDDAMREGHAGVARKVAICARTAVEAMLETERGENRLFDRFERYLVARDVEAEAAMTRRYIEGGQNT